jgi:hypothetical protein
LTAIPPDIRPAVNLGAIRDGLPTGWFRDSATKQQETEFAFLWRIVKKKNPAIGQAA